MVTLKTNTVRLTYKLAEIVLIHSTDSMNIHLSFPGLPTMGFFKVDSEDWYDGEVIRFAMDTIDLIYAQWDRVEHRRLLNKNEA